MEDVASVAVVLSPLLLLLLLLMLLLVLVTTVHMQAFGRHFHDFRIVTI